MNDGIEDNAQCLNLISLLDVVMVMFMNADENLLERSCGLAKA